MTCLILLSDNPSVNTNSDTPAIIAIVISVLALIVSLVTYYKNKRDNEKLRLNDYLMTLLNMGMQYPFVEDSKFIKDITDDYEADEKAIQYELYCIAWFNFIEQLYNYYGGKKDKIEDFIQIKEVIISHRLWWENNVHQNLEGYKANKFHDFINTYLK